MPKTRIVARLAVMLAAAHLLGAAAAPLQKPAFALKTKSAEIEITIDDALKAYPGLYDNLLAEARRDAAKWSKETDKTRREEPEMFRGGKRHTFERSYKPRSVVGRYVAILRDDGSYQGGAHPNSMTDTILWDTSTQKRVSIRPFFKETADNGATMTALARLVKAAACAEKKARDVECEKPDDITGVEPKLLGLGPITPAPSTEPGKSSGLTFHFSPYAIGAYAEGPYTVFVPWTDFKSYLSPEGAALFGGTRPEKDAKEAE
jgi:hypothetical protein